MFPETEVNVSKNIYEKDHFRYNPIWEGEDYLTKIGGCVS